MFQRGVGSERAILWRAEAEEGWFRRVVDRSDTVGAQASEIHEAAVSQINDRSVMGIGIDRQRCGQRCSPVLDASCFQDFFFFMEIEGQQLERFCQTEGG